MKKKLSISVFEKKTYIYLSLRFVDVFFSLHKHSNLKMFIKIKNNL